MICALPAAAASDPDEGDVQHLLQAMAHAVRSLDYEGTFVYLHGNQLESMHIVHSTDGQQERERLISLNGAEREVVRDGKSVTCILPDAPAGALDSRPRSERFPRILPLAPDELSAQYDFHLLGDARVAGRPAKAIGIVPRDGLRYGYRIYIDEETALPLKSDLMNERAQPVEQIMFTSLRVDPSIQLDPDERPAASAAATSGGTAEAERQAKSDVGNGHRIPNWLFKTLPDGFRLRVYDSWNRPSGSSVEHYVLSDGLATVSVYVEQADRTGGLQGGSHMGAVNAWGNRIHGHQVTVVGEVPTETVRQVAESIEYRGSSM